MVSKISLKSSDYQQWDIIVRMKELVFASGHINWALADQAVLSGNNFLSGILLARVLGLEGYGSYTLALSIVLFVQSLQHQAINTAMMSIGPKYDAAGASSYFGAVFSLQLLFAIASTVLTLIMVAMVDSRIPAWGLHSTIVPIASAVLFCQIQEFLRRYFFCVGRPGVGFALDACRYFGQLVALSVLLVITNGTSTYATALWITSIPAALTIPVAGLLLPRLVWFGPDMRDVAIRKWHFSKWLIGSGLLSWTMTNLFYVAAGVFLGAVATGAMKAAFNIVGITNIVFLGLENVVPAEASRRLAERGQRALNAYTVKVTLLGSMLTAVLVFVFGLVPEFWLELFYGSSFRPYGSLVRWWCVIDLFLFLGLPIRAWFRSIEDTRAVFLAYVLSSLVSLVVAYPLIMLFGVSGALMGVLASNIANIGFLLFLMFKKRDAAAHEQRSD